MIRKIPMRRNISSAFLDWREILTENKDAVVGPLRQSAELMQQLADLIEGGRDKALEAALEEARLRRRKLDANL